MPKYFSHQEVRSGIPLGGIGAGKIEILPCGVLDFITFQNNISQPITNSRENSLPCGILGNHFAFYIKPVLPANPNGVKRRASSLKERMPQEFCCLLQTVKIDGYPNIEKIEFEGLFPFARLKYIDKRLPIDLSLCAYSAFILNDFQNSSLPLAIFDFKIENRTSLEFEIGLLACAVNTVGPWMVGRFNSINENKKSLSLNLSARRPLKCDRLFGSIALSIPRLKDFSVSYLSKWNIYKKPFVLDADSANLKAFRLFQEAGRLPDINITKPVDAESWGLCGALCVNTHLKPKESKNIPFIYSWYFPDRDISHYYEKKFKNVSAVSRHGLKYRSIFYKKISRWQGIILENNKLPAWLKDALINNLYPFVSSSIFTKEKNFCLLESPAVCPLSGTLDVRFYASVATALFFPELELNEIQAFARRQHPDGYVPHDLGRLRMDMPSIGTTGLYWKDLNSKFVLMCLRDYLWTKNKGFLNAVYPKCLLAVEWLISCDRNNDYLPDNEGQDTTFDVWPFYGASSYASGLFLAALLAIARMAEETKDKENREKYSQLFIKAKDNFEKKLWKSDYFISYHNDKVKDESCLAFQAIGQWYASMLGLGYIVEPQKVKKSIAKVFSLNIQASQFGLVNSISRNKAADSGNPHAGNFFIGLAYAFCALAIYEGFKEESLSLSKKIWEHIALKQKNPWNQPDMIDAQTGEYLFGDHYMRSLSIWAIPLALSKTDKSVKLMLERLRKR